MSGLSVQNLTVSFKDTACIQDLSFEIPRRSTMAMIGESGSGKSLTALSIMGLLPHSAQHSGSITLGDTRLAPRPSAQLDLIRGKDIAMVFQEPMSALNPIMPVAAQILEPLLHHKIYPSHAEARARVQYLCERVGLPSTLHRAQTYPHQLSGGQRQRVMIAIALACAPHLLIADEPTTALDVTTQTSLLDLLKELVTELDLSLLFITHDLSVAQYMSDHMIVMKGGRSVDAGPTAQLLSTPSQPYTRELIAASKYTPRQPKQKGASLKHPLCQLSNVTYHYPQKPRLYRKPHPSPAALKDITLTLHKGERLGLVGESGCGKSTLARLILGFASPTSGRISMPQIELSQERTAAQVVFQDPYRSFNPRHKVSKILSEPFFAEPQTPCRTVIADRISKCLHDVGLHADDAPKFIHEFSGGQRQRIAIARALITNPSLIVFDEATSALDMKTRTQILDLVQELHSVQDFSYLFITHDMSVLEHTTDTIAVMKAGEIVEHAKTPQVLFNPQHAYTQNLLAHRRLLSAPS